jgi:phosphohistidine phosphatase SixA
MNERAGKRLNQHFPYNSPMRTFLQRIWPFLAKGVKTFIIFLVLAASLLTLNDNKGQIRSVFSGLVETENGSVSDEFWAKKILEGGYILYFRHAERDKYIDVHVYDSLESNFQPKSASGYRLGEQEYFSGAVCLNERGLIQARAIGEVISDVKLPVGKIIVSPSCRARQTASIAFGGFDKIAPVLVHRGVYNEDFDEHKTDVKNFLAQLDVQSEKNTVVIAHNDVIDRVIFSNSFNGPSNIVLEEGGFVVISQGVDGVLTLEHTFTNFLNFSSQHFERPKG